MAVCAGAGGYFGENKRNAKREVATGLGRCLCAGKDREKRMVDFCFSGLAFRYVYLATEKQIRYEENLYDGKDINIFIEVWF